MAFVIISETTTTMGATPIIRFDKTYIKTIPGMLKIAEAVTSILGYICVQCVFWPVYRSGGGWYSFVAMTGFWVSLNLLVFYLFHIIERFQLIPWLIIETGFAGIWSVFFFIAACIAAANAGYDQAWGAAAFFGFVAMVIYGYEAFIKYKKWKGGETAQGERTVHASAEGMPATGMPIDPPPSYTPAPPSYPKY